MLTAITGNKSHQMEFLSESFGGIKKSKPEKQQKE
jgi:truncated hemoglobin YjbI